MGPKLVMLQKKTREIKPIMKYKKKFREMKNITTCSRCRHRPFGRIVMLRCLDVVKGSNLHVSKQRYHLQIMKNLIQFIEPEFPDKRIRK